MARIDRYMLSQLLVMFGFFSLVLVALFWINRAVVLFDRLIGDGQSAMVFLEFTALGLPKLIVTVLPIATFSASVYVTNRMTGESELTVLQAAGAGPWRLARPVFVFGLCVAAMMTVLSHFLVPMAEGQLKQREAEVSRNLTARLLTAGVFLHPTDDVTFYTREIDSDGVLRDVFLSDRRNREEGVIYTAAEAYLARNGDATTLIMVNGMAQRHNTVSKRLATAKFRDFSFDISPLVGEDGAANQTPRSMITPELLWNWPAIAARSGSSEGDVAEELHGRFAQPLFCLVAAMIGFATLMLGGFSRFGVWREAVIAFALLIAIDGTRGTLVTQVREAAALWPLLYLPALIGALLSLAMLWQAAHPGWTRRVARKETCA